MVDNQNPNREIFLKYAYSTFGSGSGSSSGGDEAAMNNNNNGNSEQDRLLPIANVGRIMKQILPSNAKVSKEAKETMQECVSEFISFVTIEAADKCHKEKRKTVNGDDVCWAMGSLGFDDYVDPLRRYLDRYREQEGERSLINNINNNQNNTINTSDGYHLEDGKTTSGSSSIPFQFSFMDSNKSV
ncbi:nuclear transcription factor Y subunit B-4-like [Impatiens glandulifera]|uniref:nuclear transcription factor Y subunit B-4-like n=1 Tax=Impatiens glandulifera TaxID=253017 RepID=UPI001FB164FB|nr:nuclear transcription factor Y subunit B-4-like [Impatiens glandulifera]